MVLPIDPELVANKTTEIVVALLNSQNVDPATLPALVRDIRNALGETQPLPAAGSAAASLAPAPFSQQSEPRQDEPRPTPAVRVEDSITPDFIISLEDGKRYRSLRRHLMAKYQMTPEDYRRKWGLPPDYPMVAPSYAEQRSIVAKRTGLGTNKPSQQPGAPGLRSRA